MSSKLNLKIDLVSSYFHELIIFFVNIPQMVFGLNWSSFCSFIFL